MARNLKSKSATNPTMDERVTALEARMDALFDKTDRILNILEQPKAETPKPAKKSTGKDKPATKKSASKDKAPAKSKPATKKSTGNYLEKSEAIELMNTSWKNRAAAAYDRRVNKGTGAVKYADFTATQRKAITADDKAKGKDSLFASHKWKDAVERHGIKESDLKW